ncbi:MAG: hypothetical protein WD535_04955 [Thermaerobacterales bacterium]
MKQPSLIQYDRYRDYDELVEAIHLLAATYPDLISTEMWDIAAAAGITIPPEEIGPYYDHISEEDQIRMLHWLDETCNGEGFVRWKPVEHPELGQVEIGGWRLKFTRQNPPQHFLLHEIERNVPFILEMMGSLPQGADRRDKGYGFRPAHRESSGSGAECRPSNSWWSGPYRLRAAERPRPCGPAVHAAAGPRVRYRS